MLFLCVNVYCHRVTTQLQLINIIIIIIIIIIILCNVVECNWRFGVPVSLNFYQKICTLCTMCKSSPVVMTTSHHFFFLTSQFCLARKLCFRMHCFQQGSVTAPHSARVTQGTLPPAFLGRLISKRIEFHLNLHSYHCKLLACGCDTKQNFSWFLYQEIRKIWMQLESMFLLMYGIWKNEMYRIWAEEIPNVKQ